MMFGLADFKKLIKDNLLLLPALALPAAIFAFTLGRYYGFYYDNHYMNLLALDLMDGFKPYLYLGSHYSIHSALFSYLVYPFFFIFGPNDVSMELVAALFHLGTVVICFKLAERFIGRAIGLIFAYLVSVAPLYLINIYTWPEYGLIGFLNILSIYFFCRALDQGSRKMILLSALCYSLSCLQAIYSLLMLPFFIIFWLFYAVIATRHDFWRGSNHDFKIEIAQPVASPSNSRLLRSPLRGSLAMTMRIGLLFFAIVAVILLAAEIFVQLDMNFFGQYFGYYRDTTFAGGFGTARPQFIWAGKAVSVAGRPVYYSVLTSILAFGSGYSKVAFDFLESAKVMFSYYRQCHPFLINVFFIIGVVGLLIETADRCFRYRRAPAISQALPLAWFIAVCISFINVYPYHILRIYIMPMPYLLAALGVKYCASSAARLLKGRLPAEKAALIALTLFLVADQLRFSWVNICQKYKHDKARAMYYKLYHGWPYGRSYKEVGEFLLKDASLKKGAKMQSALVYSVSPYSGKEAKEICAVFYNSIDWYTQNKINVIYDDIHTSYNKYGTAQRLRNYLYSLFFRNPGLKAVYFADFIDKGDNYAFFGRLYPGIKPYAIVNDDNRTDYDCVLYKFERGSWQDKL